MKFLRSLFQSKNSNEAPLEPDEVRDGATGKILKVKTTDTPLHFIDQNGSIISELKYTTGRNITEKESEVLIDSTLSPLIAVTAVRDLIMAVKDEQIPLEEARKLRSINAPELGIRFDDADIESAKYELFKAYLTDMAVRPDWDIPKTLLNCAKNIFPESFEQFAYKELSDRAKPINTEPVAVIPRIPHPR